MMRHIVVGCILFVSLSAPSLAQQRTFVSTSGVDTNPCLLQSPCRSIDAALTAVTAGGEVVVLNSGGYGPFMVDKGVSIVAPPGVYAGVTAMSGSAITIDASPGDLVSLEGLTVVGLGAVDGIVVADTLQVVSIDRCIASGFTASGLSGGAGEYSIANSVFRGNGANGALFFGNSGIAEATLTGCRLEHNGFAGINAFSGTRIAIRDSVAAHTGTGLLSQNNVDTKTAWILAEDCLIFGNEFGVSGFSAAPSGFALVTLSRSVVNRNDTGIWVNPMSGVVVSDTMITGNVEALVAEGGGSIISRGNNTLFLNDVSGVFTVTIGPQ